MKTKHILTAMVLPAMFAACTAEEIVENNNVATNANRTQVESVAFVANGEAESRLVWDEETGKFAWEDTDKFLLFPADDGTTVNESTSTTTVYPGGRFKVGSTLVTGYEYEKGEDGTYTTKAAQMGEGLWWGYAPSFEKKSRGLVGYEISTSQDADYYKSEAAQAFITPMYEISSLNYNNKLPLEMMNFYSTVVIPLTNNTKENMTLNQIVLELQGDDYFVTKGLINIGAMGDFIMAYDGEKWDDYKNLNAATTDDRKAGKLLEDMRKTYLIKEYAKAEDGEKSQVIMLNLEGDVLEAGDTKEYRMLVPATKDKVSFNIIVLAKEGYKEITAASQSNYMYNTNIYHNGEKAAFGRKDGVAKAYSIKNLVDAESNRYYVASKRELLEKIYEVNGTFTAVKVGTWNIDSEIAEAIAESDSYVIFEGDYTVADEVASRASEEGKGIELSKVAFKNEVTVLKGNKVTFVESAIERNELKANAKLVVAEGAEVVIEDGIFAGEIDNKGTLTVEATVPTTYKVYEDEDDTTGTDVNTINKIASTGAVELKGYDHNVTLNGGSLTYTAANIDGTAGVDEMNVSRLTLAATLANNITINVGEKVVWKVEKTTKNQVVTYENGAVSKYATIVNNGTILNAKNTTGLSVYDLTNNGEINEASGVQYTELRIYGTAQNAGDILCNHLYVEEGATLKNSGIATCDNWGVNNGTVVCVTRDSEIKINKGKGRINNTIGSNLNLVVNSDNDQTVFYEMTEDFSIKDFATLRFDLWSINTLSVKAEFTYEDDAEPSVNDAAYTQLAKLASIEFGDGSSLYVPADKGNSMHKVAIKTAKVKVDGNVTMYGWSNEYSGITFDQTTEVSMTKGAKLTIKKLNLTGSDVTVKAPTLLATDYDTAAEQESNSAKLIIGSNVNGDLNIKPAAAVADVEAATTFVTSYANVGAKTVYVEGLNTTTYKVNAAN